jgi:hypothetical protein
VTTVENELHPEALRHALLEFWSGAVDMAAINGGVELTVPQSYPDGWQIVLRIDPIVPGKVKLHDSGKTLWQLAQFGQNIEAELIAKKIDELKSAFRIERDGWTLFKIIAWPAPGEEVHLFTEALVSIANLSFLHDPTPRTPNVARATVEKVFRERKISVQQNVRLEGRVEKKIIVDYFAQPARPLAVQVLGRRGTVTSYMEQWGFRWRDLHDANPRLLRVMLYDPAVQDVDSTATAIGESVCDYFGPFHETSRLHDIIDRAQADS